MAEPAGGLLRHIRLRSATALVVANVIGAGIFTTTGFQAADLGHPGYIFALWIVGGILAFCGALSYAELGASMPEAGAEYVYLRETYGAVFGFMSAFVSLIAGFSAPIAVALKGLVAYGTTFIPALAHDDANGIVQADNLIAIALAWLLVAIHLRGAKGGVGFNDFVTLFKVAGIALIIIAAFAAGNGAIENFTRVSPRYADLNAADKSGALATSLIFVMFCYSGWNAAAYVAAEMNDPQRNLPRALLAGTAIVVLLYLGMNAVYFYGADVDTLAGEVEVGLVAARALFGETGIKLVTLVLCVSMLASASAMTIAGPRVYYAFGKDFGPLRALARTNATTGAPATALVLQGAVTTALILSGRVDQITQYAGFTLTLFASLAVSCAIVLRIRRPDMPRPFRAWGYPLAPLLFLGVSTWTMIWAFRGRPIESILALLTALTGGVVFYAVARRNPSDGTN